MNFLKKLVNASPLGLVVAAVSGKPIFSDKPRGGGGGPLPAPQADAGNSRLPSQSRLRRKGQYQAEGRDDRPIALQETLLTPASMLGYNDRMSQNLTLLGD